MVAAARLCELIMWFIYGSLHTEMMRTYTMHNDEMDINSFVIIIIMVIIITSLLVVIILARLE